MDALTKQFREKLCTELQLFDRKHPEQRQTADTMREFITRTPDCFERSHKEGHITGSAWLINPRGDKALLTLHRKLQRWMQTGGHADGDPEPLSVALREATEESGIAGIIPLHREIFDIDIHRIPGNEAKNEPAHLHYDIRYLLQAPHENFTISDESEALAWWARCDFEQRATELDASVLRMAASFFQLNNIHSSLKNNNNLRYNTSNMNKPSSRSVYWGLLRQFVYLCILVLVVVTFWQVGDHFKSATVQEYGIFESTQSIILFLIALSFLLQATFNKNFRYILICMGLLALAALVREQDAYFDDLIPLIGWGWCWIFPLAGLCILLHHRHQMGDTLITFLRSNAFHMMMTAIVVIIPVAQCLGHRSFLADLMGDANLNAFLMRRILEEPIELLGYIQILLASLECLFEMRTSGKS